MMHIDSLNNVASEMMDQTERIILDQLNDFVSRGLIEVQKGEMTLVRQALSDRVEVRQMVKLVLKDKEYILKLEKENAELRALIARVRSYIHD